MRTVDVEYRTYFGTRTQHIEVPERWEDLKPYQFEVCAQLHIAPPSDEEFIRKFFRLKKSIVRKLTKLEAYKLTELVGFAVTPAGTTSNFYIEQIPGTSLLAPTNRLGNMTLEHFALMDTYFFQYVNEPTEQNLHTLVAALYLKKKDVITAIDFTERVNFIRKHIDKCTLYAIFLNYLFVRRWLARSFRHLFDNGEEEEQPTRRKYNKPPKPVKSLPKWVEIIDGFVGEDILNYEKYTQLNCIRAFKLMNNRIKNYKKNGK